MVTDQLIESIHADSNNTANDFGGLNVGIYDKSSKSTAVMIIYQSMLTVEVTFFD